MMFNKLESSVLYECGISNRINARSVSWNANGTYLALGCSDRMTRLYAMSDLMSNPSNSSSSSSSSPVREFVVIPSAVDRVRFHPTQDHFVATSGNDSMVKLWDIRSATTKSPVGQIDLQKNGVAIDIAWCSGTSTKENLLCVTERNSVVHIVDTRKLSSSSSSTTTTNATTNNQTFKAPSANSSDGSNHNKSSSNSPFVKTFDLRPKIVDACIFSPSGDHLVAATSEEGYGELTVWNWEEEGNMKSQQQQQLPQENNDPNDDTTTITATSKNISNKDVEKPQNQNSYKKYVYPAHTGPIYSLSFSRNGRTLATGGGDALVGLWDVDAMVCTSTVTRCNRFIRSVSFTYDSLIVATSTEENNIDIATSATGDFVGKVSMTDTSRNNRGGGGGSGGGGGDRNAPGADEIAFHPKAHLLACARCDSAIYSPLTVMKLNLGRQ